MTSRSTFNSRSCEGASKIFNPKPEILKEVKSTYENKEIIDKDTGRSFDEDRLVQEGYTLLRCSCGKKTTHDDDDWEYYGLRCRGCFEEEMERGEYEYYLGEVQGKTKFVPKRKISRKTPSRKRALKSRQKIRRRAKKRQKKVYRWKKVYVGSPRDLVILRSFEGKFGKSQTRRIYFQKK